MFSQLNKFKSDNFFKLNLIFFIGSLAVSFLNYLYYPILGRLLSVESFGELQLIVSMYTQVTILFTVLSLITVNIVANNDSNEEIQTTISEFQKLSLYISIALLILSILIAPILQSIFKFESAVPFVLMICILISNLPIVFRTAYLRGKSDFLGTSFSGIITSVSKIIISSLLVYIGLKTSGAIGGLIIANIINFIYINSRIKKHGFKKLKNSKRFPDWKLIKPQLPYAALVLFTSLIITLYSSIDVTLVKYLFPVDVAGRYAGISIISNIVLFITGSFAVVILSTVKKIQPASTNNKILLKSFILTSLVGGSIAIIFSLLPNQTVNLLFGNKYSEFADLLPYLSISMLLVSLSTLFTNYHIALRNYSISIFVFISAFITAILLIFNNQSPTTIVQSLLMGSALMFTLVSVWSIYKALNIKFLN